MGLPDAEALADLIDARSEAERRRAARLAEGALSTRVENWRARLVEALALAEAHLDFSEEEDVSGGAADVDALAVPLRDEIAAVLAGSVGAEKLSDGFHIALVGPPNAGKSSLLNALAGRDAAIVSEEAGTTRDVVAVEMELGGYRVTMNDTAGLRTGAAGVEALGIARTQAVRATADLVVEVRSPDTVPVGDVGAHMVVAHKADLMPAPPSDADIVSALSDPGSIDALRSALAERVRAGMAGAEAALVTRARQRSALGGVVEGLEEAIAAGPLELKAEGLRLAAAAMARMTGEIGIEDVLDDVFGRFCIGK
jgi:tRNA modification GTPase